MSRATKSALAFWPCRREMDLERQGAAPSDLVCRYGTRDPPKKAVGPIAGARAQREAGESVGARLAKTPMPPRVIAGAGQRRRATMWVEAVLSKDDLASLIAQI